MRIILWIMLAVLGFIMEASSILMAQSNQTSSYYCTADVAGGLMYNEAQQKWVGASLHTDNQFVVRLNLVRTYVRKKENQFDQDQLMKVYDVTITPRGENFHRQCVSSGSKEI